MNAVVFDGDPERVTLAEARQWLREVVDDGARCPCCTQLAKVYRRKVHATMARTLIRMYRATTPGEYLYLPSIPQKSRDCTGMAWWGLIDEEKTRRDDGGRAGWWRVTPHGVEWVLRLITVPKYARVYDGRVLRHEGDPVSIVDALGTKFDYRDLMEGR